MPAAPRREKTAERPYLEVAFHGGGLRPETVSAEDLARLVLESVALVKAVAAAQNVQLPPLWLKGVFKGSAAVRLYSMEESADAPFERVLTSVHRTVQQRGKRAPAPVRVALERVWGLTQSGPGPVRIAARETRAPKKMPVVYVSKPLQERHLHVDSITTLHGRVVGLEEVRERVDVKLKLHGGAKLKLAARPELLGSLVERFGRSVRVRASVRVEPDGVRDEASWKIVSLEKWDPGPFLDGIDQARDALKQKGVRLDIRAALARLRGDDE